MKRGCRDASEAVNDEKTKRLRDERDRKLLTVTSTGNSYEVTLLYPFQSLIHITRD